jgi:hypothetical protein
VGVREGRRSVRERGWRSDRDRIQDGQGGDGVTVERAGASPVPKNLVDAKKLADTLVSTVYPAVQGVTLQWFPPDVREPKGVLLVTVPAQPPSARPFVLRRVVADDGRAVEAFNIPTRAGADTSWTRAEGVHAALARASLVESVLAKVATSSTGELLSLFGGTVSAERSFQAGLGEGVEASVAEAGDLVPGRDRRAAERIASIRREMDWQASPTYFLLAFPPRGGRGLTKLHAMSGVRGALGNPPVLRPMGWHLASGLEPEVRDGGLALIQGSRSIIWLDRDGFFTAGVLATPEFLGWGVNHGRENGPFSLNSLSLIEYTMEFYRFVYGVLALHASPGTWTFRVATRGFKTASGGVQLSGGLPEEWHHHAHDATGDDLDEEFPGSGDPGVDALNALESVYGQFGLGVEDIPLREDHKISEAAIKARDRLGLGIRPQ